MSESPVTDPVPAAVAPPADSSAREKAAVSAWGDLLQAARITAVEQDLDLRYLAVLDQAANGGSLAGVVGRLEHEVHSGDVGERLVAIKRGALLSGSPRQGRVDIVHDGVTRAFEVTATPRRDEQGTVIGVLSVMVELGTAQPVAVARASDGPEQDQPHAQLLQTRTLEGIGRLAGGVAHDFNNLLTVILGYCELLRMRQRGGTELEEINNAARRASQLTRQLLAFSRRQILQVETLDLNGLIRGLHRMLRRIIGEDVVLDTHLADDLLWVAADIGQMEQVLLNLVVNARDAMPSGGTLRIATSIVDATTTHPGHSDRPWVELAVSDTGGGMTDDVRSRIFEPFFRTTGDAGTGLGLATVYGIVTQTGGDIACDSAPGEGSTFRVWLPLAAPPPREPAASAAAGRQVAHGHETVLLVEDDTLVRELTARALREFGYTVIEAPDAASALRSLDHQGLAIVVSGVAVAGPGGNDLLAEIARRQPGLPVLLMTGYSEGLLQRPVDPTHLLRKPFTPTDLTAKVRALLDRG